MRNILITAMMLIVVVLLFISIINTGVKTGIEQHGNRAITEIGGVSIN